MPQLHETFMGREFYNNNVPRAVKALENIAKELKRANDLKEKELQSNEIEEKTSDD